MTTRFLFRYYLSIDRTRVLSYLARVKEKLTLTVERDAIVEAKKFARKNGTSLSKLVERQFQQLGQPSFVEKWYGKFKVPRENPNDPRLTYLLRKYVKH